MKIVGLTGGIASGKSTVSRILDREGVVVVDCDRIARDVVKKGRWGWKRVVAAFGESVLREDGEVDRPRLGEIIFKDPTMRKKLNAATHLPVFLEMWRQLLVAWLKCCWLVVVDMPLLFETGSHKWFRPAVLVHVDQGTQVRRVIARDGLSPEAALARVQSQMPLEEKLRLADILIDNNGSLEELDRQVVALVGRLRTQARWWGLLTSPITAGALLLLLVQSILR